MEKNICYFVKRYYTDFVGHVTCVDYVGPYMDNMGFVLEAQCRTDMRRQKPDTTQITYWEWVAKDGDHEVVLDYKGYKTRAFDA
jgi:hypothetical protein